MSTYQSLARKFRPQTFEAVCHQKAVVSTLKNAISFNRVSHAYLFAGPRGVGKTTLARLFAKALNCQNLQPDCEPCNECACCKEITQGHSLDVIEIDGASNRGIDDIRQLNETVLYQPASARFKIYIIDEVHMLTKEAFNALLKTLEEPPAHVKFFFATTEPHKVLPTILSRTQRFDLQRIPLALLCQTLEKTLGSLSITIEPDALIAIGKCADGSLRDGQSLLDQLVCRDDHMITYRNVADLLGLASKDALKTLDEAYEETNFSKVFTLVLSLYESGKDLGYFFEMLCQHYQTILKCHSGLKQSLGLSSSDHELYEKSLKIYSKEELLTILDYLIASQDRFFKLGSKSMHLECMLIHILQSKRRLSLEKLTQKLYALKEQLDTKPSVEEPAKSDPKVASIETSFAPSVEKLEADTETVLRFAAVELNGVIKK